MNVHVYGMIILHFDPVHRYIQFFIYLYVNVYVSPYDMHSTMGFFKLSFSGRLKRDMLFTNILVLQQGVILTMKKLTGPEVRQFSIHK